MTTRQKIKAFSIAAGICAALNPYLAAGAKQAAKPKITAKPKTAVHQTMHRLNMVLHDGATAGANGYNFLWSIPERPGVVWDAPPQWWLDVVPSGDTVEVHMPGYPNSALVEQMNVLRSACEKRHITVKEIHEP